MANLRDLHRRCCLGLFIRRKPGLFFLPLQMCTDTLKIMHIHNTQRCERTHKESEISHCLRRLNSRCVPQPFRCWSWCSIFKTLTIKGATIINKGVKFAAFVRLRSFDVQFRHYTCTQFCHQMKTNSSNASQLQWISYRSINKPLYRRKTTFSEYIEDLIYIFFFLFLSCLNLLSSYFPPM